MLLFFLWMLTPGSNRIIWRRWSVFSGKICGRRFYCLCSPSRRSRYDSQAREAIMKYELYLRYYRLALEYTGHPHAYHCIGSAFAVRTLDYVAQGGMNKRQAGEDFYFLQKLIATGRYATLQSTQVYPSPRFSGRTPFGTGQAVRQIVQESGHFRVYHPQAFRDLKCFFQGISTLYKVDEAGVRAIFNSRRRISGFFYPK